jgi:teichuronic acid biosynthesis glycosyltransferase TuaG
VGTSAVSVIMAARNAQGTVRAAVSSVLAQDYSDFELVVVDDASDDATSSILTKLAADRLRVVRVDARVGRSAARNRAIREARHGLIAIMDADDFSLPTRLSKSVEFLDSESGLAGVGGQAVAMDGGQLKVFGVAPTDREVVRRTLLAGQMPLVHPSLLIRRDVLDATGGYDETVTWCEDLELLSRAAQRFEFTSSPDVWLLYRKRPHDSWSQLWNTERSRRRIANRLASRRTYAGKDAAATLASSARAWVGQRRQGSPELPNPTPEMRAALDECLAYDTVDAAALSTSLRAS